MGLVYAKDRKNMLKGKKIPISDIRAVHVGFASENLGTKYSHKTTTPEWHCFSIVLRTRTVDFSTSTEEDAALWAIGLRTLLEWNRGDTRSREVGRFFWQRAAMRTRHNAKSADKTHMDYLAGAIRSAVDSWVRPGSMHDPRGMTAYGGGSGDWRSGGGPGGGGSRFDRMTAITSEYGSPASTGARAAALHSLSNMSPSQGISPRRLSPRDISSPMERLRAAGQSQRPSSPAGQSPYYRNVSPRRVVGSPSRINMQSTSFGSNRSSGF